MGFRNGSYAKVWSVEPVSQTATKLRISISRKNRLSGEYEQDFSGFVSCVGTACAQKAVGLKEGDRIHLGDVDVSTVYNRERNITYTNYKIFSFDIEGSGSTGANTSTVDDPDMSFVNVEEGVDELLPY